ncbi:MAG: hypothetical protein U1A27_14490 [Phycisphaerae bacterium]
MFRAICRRFGQLAAGTILGLSVAGCGTTFIDAPLPNSMGFSLADLRAIQRDPTMTVDQRRAAIRAALGLADTPEDNRIADFLRTLPIP